MKTQTDIYETITAAIVEAIEAGAGKFEMPWHAIGTTPTNASTGRRYTGINILVLRSMAAKYGYLTQLWATYQQWKQLGTQVRQGQKSVTVVFWKFCGEHRHGDSDSGHDEPESEANGEKVRCFARAYHVFNVDQVDGFAIPVSPVLPESQRIAEAERFFQNTGAQIIENDSKAYYDLKSDQIHMPPFQIFKRPALFRTWKIGSRF